MELKPIVFVMMMLVVTSLVIGAETRPRSDINQLTLWNIYNIVDMNGTGTFNWSEGTGEFDTLCIRSDCRTAWPAGGGGGGTFDQFRFNTTGNATPTTVLNDTLISYVGEDEIDITHAGTNITYSGGPWVNESGDIMTGNLTMQANVTMVGPNNCLASSTGGKVCINATAVVITSPDGGTVMVIAN